MYVKFAGKFFLLKNLIMKGHLKTESHKNKVDNFILKLDNKTNEQILEEYPQYIRNSVGFYDEDFLIDGDKEETSMLLK